MKALLRAYSYVFEGLLALFVIAMCAVALSTHSPLNLTFLPWTGAALTWWLLSLAVFGLITLLLALGGKLRVLFFLWSLAVFLLLFKGLFFSFYSFAGPVSFKVAVCLTAGSLAGAIGAFPWARRPAPVRRPQKW